MSINAEDATSSSDDQPIYLVAPDSTKQWIRHFIDGTDTARIVHTGEGEHPDLGQWSDYLGRSYGLRICILSSHNTLLRDCSLAKRLSEQGHSVIAQSYQCAQLAVDKFAMKQAFDHFSIPTPPWANLRSSFDRLPETPGGYVIKNRNSTQSHGMRLVDNCPQQLEEDEFVELYTGGVEYSAIAYFGEGQNFTLPLVGKGATTPELLPPWRRQRNCPATDLSPETNSSIQEITLRVGEVFGVKGFIEVEFVVEKNGRVYVLEVNPRVAGTMRMAAMAADVALFSLPYKPIGVSELPAVLHTAEIPYTGAPIIAPEEGVFATSRLTVSASSLAGALQALCSYEEGKDIDMPEPSDGQLDGGSDRGYAMTGCLWGREPEPLVVDLADRLAAGASIVDAGCGEGRNAVYLAGRGHAVRAFDVSPAALNNARAAWSRDNEVEWELGDATSISLPHEAADAVVLDSVFHWLVDATSVEQVAARMQRATRVEGLHLICAFNDRRQEFGNHQNPPRCLLGHEQYLALYRDWRILSCVDTDIVSSHADVPQAHMHSVTKFIAKKVTAMTEVK